MTHLTDLIRTLFKAMYTSYASTPDWYGIDLTNLKSGGLTVGGNPSSCARIISKVVEEARNNPGIYPSEDMLSSLQRITNNSIFGKSANLIQLFLELLPCYVDDLPVFYDCLILTMKVLHLNGCTLEQFVDDKHYIYAIGAVNLKSDFLDNVSSITDLDESDHTYFFGKMAYGRATVTEYRAALIPYMIAVLSQACIGKIIYPKEIMETLKKLLHSPDHNLRIDTAYVMETLECIDNIAITSLSAFINIPEDRLSPGTFTSFERSKLDLLKELWHRGRNRVDAELGAFFQFMKRNRDVISVDYKDYIHWLSELSHVKYDGADNVRSRTRLFGMIHLLESAHHVMDKNCFTLSEAVCTLESLDPDVLNRLDLKVLYNEFDTRALNIELPWWLYCVGIIHILTLNGYPTLFKLECAIEDIERISLSHVIQFDPNRRTL